MADYKIEDIYQGGYSNLSPDYGSLFSGYRVKDTSTIGLSTDPRTANILNEVSQKIAAGEQAVELSLIQPEILEAIPKQHLQEVNRLAKLTGVDITVHGPLIDASGVTQQGFDNQQREIAERKIIQAIGKSHELNPSGNVPVTFHTANQLPGTKYSKTKEGEEIEFMPVVNRDTGQITGAKKQERFYPELREGGIRKEVHTPNEQLEIMNSSQWDESLQQLIVPKEHADKILSETYPFVREIISKKMDVNYLTPIQKQNLDRFENAYEQLGDIRKHLSSIFDKAYKAYKEEGNEKALKYMENVAKNFSNNVGQGDVIRYSSALQNFMQQLRPNALHQKEIEVPSVFVSAEKYAIEKSNETFGNAAWESYKKYKGKAPIISIENPPAGFGLSRAEDVKNIVVGSREQFVKKAVENGISKSRAEKEAEKLIGATWDVGHINQLRQFGFSSEDIIKEAEKVAPYVKHVHLSDNFGMENTELPMGMGNVDLKEVMKKLGKKGEKAKKIIEAAHWWKHQQSSPVAVSLEALGSPIYSMNMSPYWNQAAGFHQGYYGGYGMMLPQVNYEMFGAGFSQLPAELGGQRQGGQGGRMSGRPME